MKFYCHLPALAMAVASALSAVWAQSLRNDLGKREFEANCAVCHGLDGKGQGPYLGYLRVTPPDLTTLAKNNGGILPMDRLYQSIRGSSLPSHGPSDMPIWGLEYSMKAATLYFDTAYNPEVSKVPTPGLRGKTQEKST